jgi:hypothetical protein
MSNDRISHPSKIRNILEVLMLQTSREHPPILSSARQSKTGSELMKS